MIKPLTLKLGLSLLGLLPLSGLQAQSFDAQQAFAQALEVRAQWAGPGYPAADVRLNSAYTDANGLTYVYVQQQWRGIPVYNRVQSLAFRRGRLVHHTGAFVPAKQLMAVPSVPALPAATAVSRTLQHLNLPFASTPARLSETPGPEARQTFAAAGVARRDIVASLTWAYDEAGQPHLAWNVNIELLSTPDWWNVRVDAATGAIIGQDNWTVQETAGHQAAPAAGTATAKAPVRAAAARLLPPPNTATANYLVVPYPRESPGTLGLQTDADPWLKAGATNNATTHGWNFDGTANYALTRGNNVSAYDDAANANAPGNFAASQTAAPSLSFFHTPNFALAPGTVANRNAAVVNLFYWNNIVHDLTYQYGFTEAAGNFQADNLGRGGLGNDFVRAEAQDGSGTNNANFSTPPDGVSGRMQMYLWSPAAQPYALTVTAPAAVAGPYTAVEGNISTNNSLATVGPVSGQVALYTDAGTTGPGLACGPHVGTALTGKIALIARGTCLLPVKVKNAQLAGAIGVIVVNNAPGAPVALGGSDNSITIPSVMISQADGALLATKVSTGLQVTLPQGLAPGPQLDGDFDNGIVVHEYGHGLSTRLTGGSTNSSCLGNAEAGGEGWSDFLALMLTTDWATATLADGPTARPMGNYARGLPATSGGIRRYPYSTSLSVNPLTYANLTSNPEIHAIGEVWCATLWDLTWALVQNRSQITPNLYNAAATGGNTIAMNLVMQGLKLQPCQPGFLDARDAILAADSLLYQGQYHCIIWSAFARRGMGYSAVQGSSGSATDQTAAFDMPPPVTLDRVTPLAEGDVFDNTYKLTCNCQVPTTPYTLTDELPAGMQFVSSTSGGTLVGNKVTFNNLSFTALGQTRTVSFRARATAPTACAPVLPVNDNRDASTLGGLVAQPLTGTSTWASSGLRANSGTRSWRAPAPTIPTDFVLTSGPFVPTGLSILSFYHYFDFEGGYDGGTVELSLNNGTSWQNAAGYFFLNGCNGSFDASTAGGGQRCFSGNPDGAVAGANGFIRSALDLRSFAGRTVQVRFRTRTDNGSPGSFEGWFVDDIQVINGCGGDQVLELRNSAGTLQSAQNVLTYLLLPTASAQKAGLAQASGFTAQPNPFGAQGLQLSLTLPTAQPTLALSLYDVAGRLLLHRTVERVAAGPRTLSWPEAAGLPAGLYLVRIGLPDGSSTMLRVERE